MVIRGHRGFINDSPRLSSRSVIPPLRDEIVVDKFIGRFEQELHSLSKGKTLAWLSQSSARKRIFYFREAKLKWLQIDSRCRGIDALRRCCCSNGNRNPDIILKILPPTKRRNTIPESGMRSLFHGLAPSTPSVTDLFD